VADVAMVGVFCFCCVLCVWDFGCSTSCKNYKYRRVNPVLQPKLKFCVGIITVIT
jgi:hypothetical protein